MEPLLNSWRKKSITDESLSESDSDFLEDSKSEDGIVLNSDNDESFLQKEQHAFAEKQEKYEGACVILSSSDDESNNISRINFTSQNTCNSNKSDIQSFHISNSKNETKIESILSDVSIQSTLELPKCISKKKKGPILYSDDEETSILGNKQFAVFDSDGTSDKESNIVENTCINDDKASCLENISTFEIGNDCCSTRLMEDDHILSINSNSPNCSISSHKNSTASKKGSSSMSKRFNLSNKNITKKNEYRNLAENNEDNIDNNIVIISDPNSEEGESVKNDTDEIDKMKIDLNNSLAAMKISASSGQVDSKTNELFSSNINACNDNDYLSRTESLKAEETKLNVQVSDTLKNIETTKVTLKTAKLSALPDRGARLKIYLKTQEDKLRDLRYQQSTLSNEILKLQFTANMTKLPKPHVAEKMFKLPTTTSDLNAMGKRAMETHRNQQALTIDALRTLHNSLKNAPSEDALVADPKGLNVELMPHQKHALAWLLWREKEKPAGGILADDMGLGKTLTMLSLILKSYEDKEERGESEENDKDSEEESEDKKSNWLSSDRPKLIQGKTLVVCPATLLGQWEGEIKKRLKHGLLDVLVHHGSNREKKPRRLARPDVVISTYSIVSRGAAQQQSPLFQIRWERVILDEAHQIRNYKTQTAQSMFQLKAKHRWALTGTPVHNKEIDLYALLKFLRCSPFDDLAVWKRWVDNRDAAGIQRLNTITKSLMLRRTKEGLQEKGELKSLTDKKFNIISITLDKEEQAVYEKLLNFSKTLFVQFLHQKAEKENALSGLPVLSKATHYLKNVENPFDNHPGLAQLHKQMKEISDVKSHHILVLLLRLRQFCCHPALINVMLDTKEMSNVVIEDGDGLDIDLMDKLTKLSLTGGEKENLENLETDKSALSSENPLFADNRLNSKMRKVLETLDTILKSEDKVIIVSQWVSLLNLLDRVLQARKIKYLKLTGSVPVKDRSEIVDTFNRKHHGPRVMLLSLTAGGVGLNLVGGNHLLLLDLHWNPQLESQACDRIYRVGQEKNVQIYKFVSMETIEESILKLQEKKLEIAKQVLTGAKHLSHLSLDDLKTLFQISK